MLAYFDFLFRTQVHWFDMSLILIYFVGILVYGHLFGKRIKTSHDYFLAGKTLPWWVIGMSIIGTNIGSNDYVGGAGGAYAIGIAQANFEWIGAIPAMILAAIVFIPFYWRAGVFSIPEYMGKRYNDSVRVISAVIFCLFSILIIGVFLWAMGIMLQTYLGWPIWFSILLTASVVGFYTVSGGLAAVAYTDAVQVVIMFLGAIAVAIVGFNHLGGFENFISKIQSQHPEHLSAFLPSTHPEFPWPGVLLGLGIVLSPAYWCTNQAILQRCLGARSEWDGRASMMGSAMLKMFVPLLIVLPGFFALIMAVPPLARRDEALPYIVRNLLPVGVSGLLFVAFIAALQSSISSTMNSASVMITRDIIGVLRKKRLEDKTELKLGKIITLAVLLVGVFSAPVTEKFKGIYTFVQQMLSMFQGPIFALILLGIVSKKITASAGLWTLIIGLAFSWTLCALEVNMLYIAFWSFVLSIVSLFVISRFTQAKTDEELVNLTYSTTVSKG